MDIDIICPHHECGKRVAILFKRADWGKRVYRRCMWCHKGLSVEIKVRKVKAIEDFLSKPKELSVSTPSQDLSSKEWVNVDSAPTD